MLKGANLGVATDVDGNYSLSFLDKKLIEEAGYKNVDYSWIE